MSKKLCPLCRETVYKFPEHNIPNGLYHCGMCEKNFTNEEVLNNDLFQRITQSPEVLAEKLVYLECIDRMWHSTIFPYPENPYPTRNEAIAATVVKLKEVAE